MSQKPGGAAGQVSTANRSIHPLCDPKTEAGTHQTHSPPRSNLQTFQLTSLNYPDVFSLRGEVLREKPRRRWEKAKTLHRKLTALHLQTDPTYLESLHFMTAMLLKASKKC